MSAEVLRQAAALMRERAEAATPSPWVAEYRVVRATGSSTRTISFNEPPVIFQGPGRFHLVPRGEQGANAALAASWHPAVALAVADLLDEYARLWEASEDSGEMAHAPLGRYFLAVATAYLGGTDA